MENQQLTKKRGSHFQQTSQNKLPEFGKVQPQAIDVEETLLGAIMMVQGAYDEIAHILEPATFYKDSHRRIFKAIEQLSIDLKPIDLMTITAQLKDTNEIEMVGGPFYITTLTSRIASAANITRYAYIIYEKFILREVIRNSSELLTISFENDFDGMKTMYAKVTDLLDSLMAGKRADKNMVQVMTEHIKEVDRRVQLHKKGEMTGIPTGLVYLNKYTNGWKPGELIVLASRPAMGKTAVGLNLFTKTAAIAKKHILFFSLEMDDLSLADRLICSYGGINADHLKSGSLTESEFAKYHDSSALIQQLPIYIDDTARADIKHITAIGRSKRRKGQCDMIIIDYLQLIESAQDKYSFKNREQAVSEMSRGLKLLAKELKIPIILLAQLSRAVESRPGDKRPILADLRESGAIEQDADMVIFPYRPTVYGITEDGSGNSLDGVIILGISKNRSGRIGDVYAKHSQDLTQFFDFDYDNNPPY